MDTAAGPRALEPGTMLDGKYRVEHLLATGGMGAVYVGTHVKLRKRVAIKVLNPQLSSAPMVERFHREAITASQIGHEGIAQVTDLGTSAAGEPFLVMEYLEGESLASRLRSTGPLEVDAACELGCSILSPLEAAHRAGIVHRDLKPDNVFLVRQSRGEQVKLLDFGISRAAGLEAEFRLTTTGLILGTPYYMSPEQARGDSEVTLAADLYAFGVIMYEMLLGKVPIHGDNYNQLMYRVMTGDFVRPRAARPELPAALESLILRAMAIEPAHRPGSALELEHSLLAFCRPTFRDHTIERLSAPSVSLITPMPLPSRPLGDQPTLAATPSARVAPRRRRWPYAVAGLLGCAAAATAAILLSVEPEPEPEPVPVSAPAVVAAPTPAPAPPPPAPSPPSPPAATTVRTVTIALAVTPPTATIRLDGAIVTPPITTPADANRHQLEITAPGHAPYAAALALTADQQLSIALRALPRPPTRPPPRKPPPRRPTRIDTESPYASP